MPLLADIDWHGGPRNCCPGPTAMDFFMYRPDKRASSCWGKAFVKQTWNAGFDAKGRPIMAPNTEPTAAGTLIFPDNQGGTNWFNPVV